MKLKDIFSKKDDSIEEVNINKKKVDSRNSNDKEKFVNSLRISVKEKLYRKKIETLVCEGDGLGIQKRIRY